MPEEKPLPELPASQWHIVLKKKIITRGSVRMWTCLETLSNDYGNQFWYSYRYNEEKKEWKRDFLGHVNSFGEDGPV